jgi:hypothetical protein
MNQDIKRVNYWSNALGIIGWLSSLAYYNWFASKPPHVPIWGHVLLIVGGCFLATTFIAAVLAATAGIVAQSRRGYAEASPVLFIAAAAACPVVTFFAAKGALWLFATL